jgi:hypothetical protein
MAFTVETGGGIQDANSVATVQEYLDWWLDRGVDKSAETDVEGRLVKATDYYNNTFVHCGTKKYAYTVNYVESPREDLEHFDDTTVPKPVKEFAFILADDLLNKKSVEEQTAQLKSYSMGPIRKEYATSSGNSELAQATKILKHMGIIKNNIPVARRV